MALGSVQSTVPAGIEEAWILSCLSTRLTLDSGRNGEGRLRTYYSTPRVPGSRNVSVRPTANRIAYSAHPRKMGGDRIHINLLR